MDLFVFAKRLLAAGDEQGAGYLMKIALNLQKAKGKLMVYADEVKARNSQEPSLNRRVAWGSSQPKAKMHDLRDEWTDSSVTNSC